MPNVTKQDLVQEVARSTGFIHADIRAVAESFLAVVAEQLSMGRNIEIRGFGTFTLRERKPRPARNPRTGEEVRLSERKVPLFKFSADIKQQLNKAPAIPTKATRVKSDVEG